MNGPWFQQVPTYLECLIFTLENDILIFVSMKSEKEMKDGDEVILELQYISYINFKDFLLHFWYSSLIERKCLFFVSENEAVPKESGWYIQ